jgi:hypothetical protein
MMNLVRIALTFTIGCLVVGGAEAAVPQRQKVTMELNGCSDEGGTATVELLAGKARLWTFMAQGSDSLTTAVLSGVATKKPSLKVAHKFNDGSSVRYEIAVKVEDNQISTDAVAKNYFTEISKYDLAFISNLYGLSKAALRSNEKEIYCS